MGRSREGSTITKDGVLYARVRWTENGKVKEKTRRADNKTHARQHIKKMLRQLDDFGTSSLDYERMTFEQLADLYEQDHMQPAKYVDGRKVSGLRSLHTQKYTLVVLKDHFKKRRLRSITYRDISRFRAARINTPTIYNKPRSITTVNRELEVLRNMLNYACREGWILKNPFTSGPPLIQKAHEKKRERILTEEEEELLLAACIGRRAHLKPIVICGLDTGMRRGEILTLSWSDIELSDDTEDRLIHIKAHHTKTEQERVLGITERLYDELLVLFAASSKQSDDLVFGITNNVKRSFGSACKAIGIEGLRFHDLRHTFATRLIERGVPAEIVSKLLGHNNLNTTTRYVNTNARTARIAVEALESTRVDRTQNESQQAVLVH